MMLTYDERLTGQDPAVARLLYRPLTALDSPSNQASGTASVTRHFAPGAVAGHGRGGTAFRFRQPSQRTLVFDCRQRLRRRPRSTPPAPRWSVPAAHAIGTGTVALAAPAPLAVSVSGTDQYSVDGDRQPFGFYGPAETSLGVSGDWDNYSATVTGQRLNHADNQTALTLNGTTLPAGTYTITTNSATLSGSGQTTSPNFSGSAAVHGDGRRGRSGPGSWNVSSGGNPLNPTNGVTLDGYTGTINVYGQWRTGPTP